MKKLFLISALILLPFLSSYAQEYSVQNGKMVINVQKGEILNLDINLGDIRVSTWDKNEIEIRLADDSDEEPDFGSISVTKMNNVISVRVTDFTETSFEELKVKIPSSFSLIAKTNAGDIKVDKLDGNISLITGGGDVTTNYTTGNLSIKTSGGDITGTTISGDVDIQTSGGEIKIAEIGKSAKISTSGGDIRIGNVAGPVKASSAGGNLFFGTLKSDSKISTAGGDISIASVCGSSSVSTSGGNINIAKSNGSLKVNTAGGDLILSDISGSVSGITQSGKIVANFTGPLTEESKLTSSYGDLTIGIKSEVAMDIETSVVNYEPEGNVERHIISDFPAIETNKGKYTGKITSQFKINNGGNLLKLRTTMGTIKLIKK